MCLKNTDPKRKFNNHFSTRSPYLWNETKWPIITKICISYPLLCVLEKAGALLEHSIFPSSLLRLLELYDFYLKMLLQRGSINTRKLVLGLCHFLYCPSLLIHFGTSLSLKNNSQFHLLSLLHILWFLCLLH